MARKIIWTFTAKAQRREILEYWIKRTKSKQYSRKLSITFRKKVQLLSEFQYLGKPTEIEAVRVSSTGHYYIYYTIQNDAIIIICLCNHHHLFVG